MDNLQCAASMNNSGVVKLFLEDDRRGAFEVFKAAFAILHEGSAYCTSALSLPILPQHFPKLSSVSSSTLPFVAISEADFSAKPPSPTVHHRDEPDHAFMFSKAFAFNPRFEFGEDCIEACKAVVLFNLALVQHRRNKYYVHCPRHENTALRLYSSCLELLRQPSPLNCSNVVIAALNNKAQIFYEQHDWETTAGLLRELGQCLGKAIDEGAAKSLDEQDINGLLLNVHCQRALVCAPSA